VVPEGQVGLDAALQSQQPLLLEATGLALVGNVEQLRASPQRERLLECPMSRRGVAVVEEPGALVEQPLEPDDIQAVPVERDAVAT
jgi:hypothetical protein